MSKLEEKFKESLSEPFDGDTSYIDRVSKQCAEITEQECIGFGRWFREQCLWNDSYANKNDKELLTLYQKSKENE